jgi:mono/diheme cytochrome c family protein
VFGLVRPSLVLFLALVAFATACSDDAVPDSLRGGRSIYADNCSACHGSSGQGGVGPALDGVLATWPDCTDQVDWIGLGSDGWKTAHGDVYGATAKPVLGGMPAQADGLTLEEIRLVAAFQRATYGGLESEVALQQCGIE